jgi:glycosyltransferase involved in cell wall biosynthesis
LLPAVVAKVVERHPDTSLTMIGPDKGDGSLAETKETADRFGVASRIAFVPGVPKVEVPGWLDRNDVFVSLPDTDNAPVSVVEAMASGLPVVSSSVGGMQYFVDNGENGLLVPPRDADAAAWAVEELLTKPRLVERITVKARKKAEEHDWTAVLPKWQRILERAAA